ncbi:TPA: hypothetical protein NH480_002844 [Pseudomonas aeruginosa]|nr:hypothetical protein [Pseudomonas aeruginosa]
MKEHENQESKIKLNSKDCKVSGEKRNYLIFSDAQLEFIEKNQSIIDVEFTEEEKNFSFI